MTERSGPLSGMRVIELAHIMAGPVCGLMLADMGADVVKVEKPTGDDTRRTVPPEVNGESAAFMIMNRNKRGVVLDLKSDEGKAALKRLPWGGSGPEHRRSTASCWLRPCTLRPRTLALPAALVRVSDRGCPPWRALSSATTPSSGGGTSAALRSAGTTSPLAQDASC